MEPEDRTDLAGCIDCGATVDKAFDRPFAITDEIVLCFTCAVRRGGAYDSDSEKWSVAPGLDGLVPEERSPSP